MVIFREERGQRFDMKTSPMEQILENPGLLHLAENIFSNLNDAHCEFEDFIRNRKLSKYLGASKWKNEVMVIKNTPNENDWPRAILELFQKK